MDRSKIIYGKYILNMQVYESKQIFISHNAKGSVSVGRALDWALKGC